MRRALVAVLLGGLVTSCASSVAPDVLQQWRSKTLYTCCNLHYENPAKISDANYFVGSTLPLGSSAIVQRLTDRYVTFSSGAQTFTIRQEYGTNETAEQFAQKWLVEADPRERLATFPPAVRDAITDGRVEVGMTREQVLMALGYPPTHRTASLAMTTWTYWYNRWFSYQVQFNGAGVVTAVVGSRAATRGEPVAPVPPPPTPAAEPRRRY